MQMNKVYHPWWTWEEVESNMWGSVPDSKKSTISAYELMKDYKRFGESMINVVETWQFSCENHLSDKTINRRSWLGCAAVANYLQLPENITRKAWSMLARIEKELANNQADMAINHWEELNERFDTDLHKDLDGQMLLCWTTR